MYLLHTYKNVYVYFAMCMCMHRFGFYTYKEYIYRYMECFKNSRNFCVRNSVVTLFLKIEKKGENKHNLQFTTMLR